MDDATLLDPGRNDTLALGATQAAPSTGAPSFSPRPAIVRTTVLPKVDASGPQVTLAVEARRRYEASKVLGVGGMGEVVLVDDQDIGRKVAVKRLLPELTDASIVARFVEEIRTVGRLEHPNIVPIHDVGVDEQGRYFFVMKYVHGETLESVIEKLAAGDPSYLAKYTTEVRIQIFLGLLHALEYAHAQGVVHRDVKPANVMVGQFGEVVLMDWGIAKPLAAARDAAALTDASLVTRAAAGAEEAPRSRLFATRVGALIGTPAYMSPEQARGDHASVDARSDLYSAIVLFHELLGLEHYLARVTTLDALFDGIKNKEMKLFKVLEMPNVPPAELVHLLIKGFQKDPRHRFQSAAELVERLEAILEGRAPVQCQFTMTKRAYREMGRLSDRAPFAGLALLVVLAAAVVFSGVELVRLAVHLASA
jgi:serine/threonine-protein kinase